MILREKDYKWFEERNINTWPLKISEAILDILFLSLVLGIIISLKLFLISPHLLKKRISPQLEEKSTPPTQEEIIDFLLKLFNLKPDQESIEAFKNLSKTLKENMSYYEKISYYMKSKLI